LSDAFSIQNYVILKDALWSPLFNIPLVHVIVRVLGNKEKLEVDGDILMIRIHWVNT
jgi:hypothetical protein